MNIINNQRYVFVNIGPFGITIQDESDNKRDIYINDFQNHFLVAYAQATTIHCAQGCSISWNYTLHEWERLDQRVKYVALSRARNHENIHVMK